MKNLIIILIVFLTTEVTGQSQGKEEVTLDNLTNQELLIELSGWKSLYYIDKIYNLSKSYQPAKDTLTHVVDYLWYKFDNMEIINDYYDTTDYYEFVISEDTRSKWQGNSDIEKIASTIWIKTVYSLRYISENKLFSSRDVIKAFKIKMKNEEKSFAEYMSKTYVSKFTFFLKDLILEEEFQLFKKVYLTDFKHLHSHHKVSNYYRLYRALQTTFYSYKKYRYSFIERKKFVINFLKFTIAEEKYEDARKIYENNFKKYGSDSNFLEIGKLITDSQ